LKQVRWEWPVALAAGFAVGLFYAWVIAPVRYVDTTPDTLRSDFKDQFRIAIAASYASNRNLERARARLALLGDAQPGQVLTAQAQRMLAAGESFEIVQQVAALATDLQSGVVSFVPSATGEAIPSLVAGTFPSPGFETPATPSESPTPEWTSTPLIFDTPTPRPTRTPIPTAGAPFQPVGRDDICNINLTSGLMQITVVDKRGHQLAGIEIIITSSGGEEHFFTGLKPEIANGYADYVMQAGVSYTVRVGENGAPVQGLVAPVCPDANGQTYIGGLHLTFQQP
jgi:hypothetical protein